MTQSNSNKGKWTRRAFMAVGGLLGTGLVVGVAGMAHVNRKIQEYSGRGLGEGASLNAWIRISPDNVITLAIPRAEMGQGVYTSLPMLVAEELEVEMDMIQVIHPQPESPYSNIFMVTQSEPNAFEGYSAFQKMFAYLTLVATGGSSSVSDAFTNLRLAGATAREMLRQAAATRWGTDLSRSEATQGYVTNLDTNEQLSYGELAVEAALIDLPELPELKARKDWKKLGKPAQRLDVPGKVTGEAQYGLDVRFDDLLYAAVRLPSVVGGSILSIENEAEINQMPGVEKAVLTEYGAAVIANNTWRAKNAALAIKLNEDNGGNESVSSEGIAASLEASLQTQADSFIEDEGDVEAVFQESGDRIVEGLYRLPYLAHAAMEPLNCTVQVMDEQVEVWVGHQATSLVADSVSEITGVGKANIMVHIPYLGGGFGRKGEPDFVRLATAVAMEMKGRPVMTVYSREDDMQHDFYRPAAASAFKAVVQPDGEITAWENRIASQPVGYLSMQRLAPGMPGSPGKRRGLGRGCRASALCDAQQESIL